MAGPSLPGTASLFTLLLDDPAYAPQRARARMSLSPWDDDGMPEYATAPDGTYGRRLVYGGRAVQYEQTIARLAAFTTLPPGGRTTPSIHVCVHGVQRNEAKRRKCPAALDRVRTRPSFTPLGRCALAEGSTNSQVVVRSNLFIQVLCPVWFWSLTD
jgi:hypothetical protein